MSLPNPTSIEPDVMREQLEFLIEAKQTHALGCGCRECWKYDRIREVLLMSFDSEYHEVKHTLQAKANAGMDGGAKLRQDLGLR